MTAMTRRVALLLLLAVATNGIWLFGKSKNKPRTSADKTNNSTLTSDDLFPDNRTFVDNTTSTRRQMDLENPAPLTLPNSPVGPTTEPPEDVRKAPSSVSAMRNQTRTSTSTPSSKVSTSTTKLSPDKRPFGSF